MNTAQWQCSKHSEQNKNYVQNTMEDINSWKKIDVKAHRRKVYDLLFEFFVNRIEFDENDENYFAFINT